MIYKLPLGTCIDLILTNRLLHFQNTGVLETGVIYHHALIYSFFETTFRQSVKISRLC